MKKILIVLLTLAFALGLAACVEGGGNDVDAKPVIYLYPEEET